MNKPEGKKEKPLDLLKGGGSEQGKRVGRGKVGSPVAKKKKIIRKK